ncbi:MAG: hypothetical protein RR415_14025, partial [Ruthenibacterium sp.]
MAVDTGKSALQDSAKVVQQSINAAKQTANAVKTTKKIAAQAASGNVAGAALTALKNPKTVLIVISIVLVILFIPLMFVGIFVIILPAALIQTAVQSVASFFDTLNAKLTEMSINIEDGVKNFWTLLTTGEWGTEGAKTFTTEDAKAEEDGYENYMGISNSMVHT